MNSLTKKRSKLSKLKKKSLRNLIEPYLIERGKCCGVDCDCGVLNGLKDEADGSLVEVYVDGGNVLSRPKA
jgi:hypothetical protein